MSGYVLFQTYDDGRLVGNTKEILGDLKTALDKSTENIRERRGDAPRWDLGKIRDRVKSLEARVRTGDTRARYYIDVLVSDMERMKEFSTEKGSAAVDKTLKGLKIARKRLAEDADGAADRLRRLSRNLAGDDADFDEAEDEDPEPDDSADDSEA